jgi:hypothetical protein
LVKTVACVGVIAGLLILVAYTGIAPGTVTSTRSAPVTTSPSASRPAVEPASRRPVDEADGIIDLYGNEVTDAVAKYTLDPTGSLYELHSPQTELPRLGSPKS